MTVPGNVTPAAEFNWWFDPESARIVLRHPGIEHVVIPLDVTDTALFGKDLYDRISAAGTPVARLFAATYLQSFERDPKAQTQVWDTIAAAYLLDPSLVTEMRTYNLDIDILLGPNYGRSLGHARNPPVGTQPAKVVMRIDLDRFWALYADLLTRPVGN